MTQRKEPRLWLPSAEQVVVQSNDSYLHSLWLATFGLFVNLPFMVVMQTLIPMLQTWVRAFDDIAMTLFALLRDNAIRLVVLVSRVVKCFLYGIFGYLDTENIRVMFVGGPGGEAEAVKVEPLEDEKKT